MFDSLCECVTEPHPDFHGYHLISDTGYHTYDREAVVL